MNSTKFKTNLIEQKSIYEHTHTVYNRIKLK